MNRLVRPIMFAFEPDVVFAFAKMSFGASGVPTLDTKNSKGFCDVRQQVIAITGTTANASPTVTSVSSFVGLYVGMFIDDGGTNVAVGTTISAMNPGAGTITLSANATGTNTGLNVTGGYILTLGQLYKTRLDAYNKLLDLNYTFDLTGLQGGVSTGASAPAAPQLFLTANNISNAALANIIFQTGNGTDAANLPFKSIVPANGEILRLTLKLCRSGAI